MKQLRLIFLAATLIVLTWSYNSYALTRYQQFKNYYNHKAIYYSDSNISGNIIIPPFKIGKGFVYCHGGFSGAPPHDALNELLFLVRSGYVVFEVNYGGDFGLTPDMLLDVAACNYAKGVLRSKYLISKVGILGTSRGGFVALQTFLRNPGKYFKCITFAAPNHMSTWPQMYVLPNIWQTYFIQYDDPYTIFDSQVNDASKMLLVHGTEDDTVPVSQTIVFQQMSGCYDWVVTDAGHDVSETTDGIYGMALFLTYP